MKLFHVVPLLASIAVVAPAYSADDAAPKGAASTAMSPDCAKAMKHDHGAEKGMPMPKSAKSMDCGAAASAPAKKSGQKSHDHSKFHKNQ